MVVADSKKTLLNEDFNVESNEENGYMQKYLKTPLLDEALNSSTLC